jgi:methionyl-tRNA formyltransferase
MEAATVVRMTRLPRIAFAGDRDISVKVLDFILSKGVKPLALLVPERSKASHADELIQHCTFLGDEKILFGAAFRTPLGIETLKKLALDFIIGIHFSYVVPPEVLAIPKNGILNLHPAYLPYNRGWHTASWAILENTPIGASLHLMDEGIDTGDIIHQKKIEISPSDTADTLYQRLKSLEFEVFVETWPKIVAGTYSRMPQKSAEGTFHERSDLLQPATQKIDLEETTKAGKLIRKLRALTTNQVDEAAYFEVNGKRFRLQVSIHEEVSS